MSAGKIVAVCLVNGTRDQVDDYYGPTFGWDRAEISSATTQVPGADGGWTPVVATVDPAAVVASAEDLGAQVLEGQAGFLVTDPGGAAFLVSRESEATPGLRYRVGERVDGRPSWAQLNSADPDGSAAFLGAVLGLGRGPSDNDKYTYWQLLLDGEPHAGLMQIDTRSGDVPAVWQTYFHTDDVATAAAVVAAGGGRVVVPPTTITPGDFLVAHDPHGRVFAVDDMDVYLVGDQA